MFKKNEKESGQLDKKETNEVIKKKSKTTENPYQTVGEAQKK